MAYLATGTEVLGAVALLVGLGTRWFAVPLMVTMLVAAFSVHAKNGWQAIADSASPFANENIEAAMDRLDKTKDLLSLSFKLYPSYIFFSSILNQLS